MGIRNVCGAKVNNMCRLNEFCLRQKSITPSLAHWIATKARSHKVFSAFGRKLLPQKHGNTEGNTKNYRRDAVFIFFVSLCLSVFVAIVFISAKGRNEFSHKGAKNMKVF
jgi:hypothetical protein